MDLKNGDLLIIPFKQHIPCCLPLCNYLSDLFEKCTNVRCHVVDTGNMSLGFVPEPSFLKQIYESVSTDLLLTGKGTPGKYVIAIYPDLYQHWFPGYVYNIETNITDPAPGSIGNDIPSDVMYLFQNLRRRIHIDYKEDKGFFEFALNVSNMHDFLLEFGVSYAQLGDYKTARTAWLEILKTNPSSSYALLNIGQSYSDENEFEEAEEWFTLALQNSKDKEIKILAYYNRGLSYSYMKRWSDSISDYKNCIELSPNFGMAYNNIGACYLEMGDKKSAETWFRKCLSLSDDSSENLGSSNELAKQNLQTILGH